MNESKYDLNKFKLETDHDQKTFYVSRLIKEKGVYELIEGFQMAQKINKKIKLSIVGYLIKIIQVQLMKSVLKNSQKYSMYQFSWLQRKY